MMKIVDTTLKEKSCKRGLGSFPICGAVRISYTDFSEKNFLFFAENVEEILCRQGRRLCPIMERSGMVCFDEPDTACQNRYWVNTIYSDMSSSFYQICTPKIKHYTEKKKSE